MATIMAATAAMLLLPAGVALAAPPDDVEDGLEALCEEVVPARYGYDCDFFEEA